MTPHHVSPSLATVRVIFIIQRHDAPVPGSDSGLAITINGTMRVLRRNSVDCESWGVRTVEQLAQRLEKEEWSTRKPITHVIINTPNFANPQQIGEMALHWPSIDFVMLNHTGLAYYCIDDHGPRKIREMLHLSRAMHNMKCAGNNPRFRWFDSAYGVKTLFLPNLYDTDTFVEPIAHRKTFEPLRVGSFGENRPWKNQSIAAMAALTMARRLGVDLELYVNGDRWEQTWGFTQARTELFEDLPHAKIITVPWATWSRFRQVVARMDICIHPSFDETFCVVVADGIAEGVPSVVSGAIEWAPKSWQASEPHDPMSLAAVGMSLLHSRDTAVHDGRQALLAYTKSGIAAWIDYLANTR